MRNPVKALMVACCLAVGALAWLTPPAEASCNYACRRVQHPTNPFCQRCLYAPGSNENCADDGECFCWDVQCFSALAVNETPANLLNDVFAPVTRADGCETQKIAVLFQLPL